MKRDVRKIVQVREDGDMRELAHARDEGESNEPLVCLDDAIESFQKFEYFIKLSFGSNIHLSDWSLRPLAISYLAKL